MQFFKTGDVVKAGEESCHELLICYLFPSEICSDFRQHIVSQLLFFFFFPNVSPFGWHPDIAAGDDY